MEPKPERLQKILAAAGLASRRKAEELIAAGVVSVNGHVVTEPGTKADPRLDEIRVDGKLLRGPERHVYLALYKPKGVMTTVSDPEGRPTVMDLIKGIEERVFPVGRLDYMSEGLLVLTNDGDLMAELTKAGSHVAKTYMVKVSGKPTEEEIDRLRDGIMLPPEPGLTGARGKKQPGVERRSFAVRTQPAVIQLAVDQENPWYEVTLTEGRNRQIRRMFEQIGYHIEKIKRVRYGSLTLDLEPGEFRHLTPKEVNQLRRSLETPFKPKPIRAKRKDDRAERKHRIDAARFVKGRRGKPSADATAPASGVAFRSPHPRSERPPHREFAADSGERRPFNRPRGPEFDREERREGARSPYPRKSGDFKRGGDFGDRPKRPFVRKPAEDFGNRPEGGYQKREGGFKRQGGGLDESPEKRRSSGGSKFGFSRYTKPKFAKPSKHRDLGSDSTHDFEDRKPYGDRPYSKDRGGFDKKPGGFTRDRKYSRGPGKPTSSRGEGDFERGSSEFKRGGGEFKGRGGSDFKRSGSGDFKRSGGSDFKRGGRPGSGGSRRPSGPPRGGGNQRGPSRPPRRRPE